jgi:hypothetical protein
LPALLYVIQDRFRGYVLFQFVDFGVDIGLHAQAIGDRRLRARTDPKPGGFGEGLVAAAFGFDDCRRMLLPDCVPLFRKTL